MGTILILIIYSYNLKYFMYHTLVQYTSIADMYYSAGLWY